VSYLGSFKHRTGIEANASFYVVCRIVEIVEL